MSQRLENAIDHVFNAGIEEVAATETTVLDCRGMTGFAVVFAAGVPTYQACDADGDVTDYPAATNAVSGTRVEVAWPYYLVTAGASPIKVARLR